MKDAGSIRKGVVPTHVRRNAKKQVNLGHLDGVRVGALSIKDLSGVRVGDVAGVIGGGLEILTPSQQLGSRIDTSSSSQYVFGKKLFSV